jgi:hypothetical protein
MTRLYRVGLAAVLGLALTAPYGSAQQTAAADPVDETRPATTTFNGDTGLWFVPLGEVLPAGRWSWSAYRVNFDRQEGFTDISLWPVTFGYGVGNRAELFGALSINTRIDRDTRPIFVPGLAAGGPDNNFPRMNRGWSGDWTLGDLIVGGKVALLSEANQDPVAMALRAMVKIPTGSVDRGTSSGQADFFVDYIVSKEVNERVDIAGYVGAAVRADAESTNQSNGLRYGIGFGFPTRSPVKITAELTGERYFDDSITISQISGLEDGLPGDGTYPLRSPLDLQIGATYISPRGWFAGVGGSLALAHDRRTDLYPAATIYSSSIRHQMGFQARIGYHPGARTYAPPPPPPPPPPPAV